MPIHSQAQGDEVHAILGLGPYVDEAARLAAPDVTAATDVGKVAKQLDTGTYWILQDHDPVTWEPFGVVPLASVLGVGNTTGANNISIDDPQSIEFVGGAVITSLYGNVISGDAEQIFFGGGNQFIRQNQDTNVTVIEVPGGGGGELSLGRNLGSVSDYYVTINSDGLTLGELADDLTFTEDAVTPTISQEAGGDVAGALMTIQAQGVNSATEEAGTLILVPGANADVGGDGSVLMSSTSGQSVVAIDSAGNVVIGADNGLEVELAVQAGGGALTLSDNDAILAAGAQSVQINAPDGSTYILVDNDQVNIGTNAGESAIVDEVNVFAVVAFTVSVDGGNMIEATDGGGSTPSLAFFAGSPVAKQTGSAALSLATISGSGDDVDINANFAAIQAAHNAHRTALNNYNLTTTV